MMQILAFVPARGGSKSIKNKNLTKLCGKPLIKYTFETLKKLKSNIKPFISSDDKNVLSYAKKNNFNTSYIRPKKLSTSNSNVVDAIFHAVDWLKYKYDYVPNAILLLEPTNPIRNITEIKRAISLFKKKNINSLASVCELKHHPFESIEIKKKNWSFLRRPKKKFIRGNNFLIIFILLMEIFI